jgi:hypothetical protein
MFNITFKQRILTLCYCVALCWSGVLPLNAQVTIGSTEEPVKGATLQTKNIPDVAADSAGGVSSQLGIAFPRVALVNRDSLIPMYSYVSPDIPDLPTQKKHRGLVVYNLTDNDAKDLEQGMYYWDGYKWFPLQKGQEKALFTINCADSRVMGTYIEDKELDENNRVKLIIDVSRAGTYNIKLETTNGYFFAATGVFATTGLFTVYAYGQGTPIDVQTDNLTIISNDEDNITCSPPLQVTVLPKVATYTFNCSQSKVRGVYKLQVPLDTTTNYIELSVTVTNLTGGSYEFSTNTVDGIYFHSSGTFPAAPVPAHYTVKVYGYGSPTNTKVKTMTITGNSADGATSCDINVVTCYRRKTYASIGTNQYGYTLGPDTMYTPNTRDRSRVWEMFTEPQNFGNLETSVVKIEGISSADYKWPHPGYNVTNGWGAFTDTVALHNLLFEAPIPDIVFIGYYNATGWTGDTLSLAVTKMRLIRRYLDMGGVVIANIQLADAAKRMVEGIFNLDYITARNPIGHVFTLTGNLDDPVINGPFGNVNGKYWGADCGDLATLRNLPQDQFYFYTSGPNINPTATTILIGDVTMARHKSLNFFWCGEAAWYATYWDQPASNTPGNNTISPFWINTTTHKPIDKAGYGATGGTNIQYTVSNSTLMANLLYWALTQAEFYGINKQ